MSAVVKSRNDNIQINMQSCHTFAEMKDKLKEQLKSAGDFWLGGAVSIDTGHKILNVKQVEEIKNILQGHGLQLLNNVAIESPVDLGGGDNEPSPFGQMPHFDNTALICKSLRSGQKFFADGNVVILGDVNPGAEVIAGGNILVMGSLRGMVHAGVYGDEAALIAAYRLSPTQLRIANHITRPPDGELIIIESPELARIRGGKVCIEKLKI